jgi:hypothetical protein
MRNVPPKAALERGPASDLWRNTLSQIPTVFGRLIYLSNLRGTNSGVYEHHGLALVFGPRAASEALKRSHEETFREWLSFSLEQQKADLDAYLGGLVEERAAVIETWLRLNPYRNLMPLSARTSDQELFLVDFRALLEILRHAFGVVAPDRDA